MAEQRLEKDKKRCPILYTSGHNAFATCWRTECAFYDAEKEQCIEKTKVEVLTNLVEELKFLR